MSDLPPPVTEAGMLLQQPAIIRDPDAMKQIIEWGRQQIDITYPEDPIRAPLNIVRRKFAHMEWDRVIRTQGRELRGTIASALVRDLEFQVKRHQENVLAADAEARRRGAVTFDGDRRIQEQEATTAIAMRMYDAQRRLDHELQQQAEDAASQRRIAERVNDAHQEIATITAQAIVRTIGSTSAEKTIEATRLVNDEIARIRRQPDVSEDEKHLQIKVLLETLPNLLRGLRASDV